MALVSFLLVVAFAFDVVRPRDFQRSPKLEDLHEHLPEYDDAVLTTWVGDAYSGSVTHNDRLLARKTWSLQYAQIAVIVEAFMLGVLLPLSFLR